ncbi:MAG: CYTH domain-containing protein [Gammaproteobacteria bacterium]|nr:CYTH domain-containing protein [Gammaproteobacteria bacterium]MBU1723927.1 CYTH domain-containing protein [Gammaproteobacteria bacterium]MBU2006164.1 CYTH domain-containing protein [Gammaproteobacteria bacterium]
MATEIERKFLLVSDEWRQLIIRSESFRQGYLSNNKRASVRVRIADNKATLNIKGMTLGVERPEYEYEIPLHDAAELLDQLCERPLIEKTRHFVEFGGKLWEIDEFHGDNAGLLVAEVELDSKDEVITMPSWAGKDVSHLERYYNVCLTQYPYSRWTAEERG